MKEDRRKYNGGNSTKAVRPNDKRLNPFRHVLKEAMTPTQVKEVIAAMYKKAIDGDTKAATLLMNYYLGKPKESIEITGSQDVSFKLSKLITFEVEDAEEVK